MAIGHNSKVKAGPVNADRLRSFIERIEKLEEERKSISGDVKDVYAEAKGVGYDVPTMRKIVALRAKDVADVAEQETLLDVYRHALGMGGNVTMVPAEPPSEEELEALAGRIIGEVDLCMDLVADDNQPPGIYAIQGLIGCSTGKASKLRQMVKERISRETAKQREMKSPKPEDGGEGITESSAGPDEGCSEQQPTAPIIPASRPESPAAKPVPEGGEGTGTFPRGENSSGRALEGDERPQSLEVGAVAASSPRVAPNNPDLEMPPIPDFLLRRREGAET